MDKIIIKGARENNLKNINIEIPKNKLVVVTGVSGSGKSSLAFDTIYAEGRRKYIESLSAYARQFLGGSDKPDVDSIEGLSPAISIDQKTTNSDGRSPYIFTCTHIRQGFLNLNMYQGDLEGLLNKIDGPPCRVSHSVSLGGGCRISVQVMLVLMAQTSPCEGLCGST